MSHHDALHKIRHALDTRQRRLDLTSMNLSALPPEIGQLKDVEVLDLSGNRLTDLPIELLNLPRLKRLFLTKNAFDTWPSIVGRLTGLEMLSFKSNALRTIPDVSALPAGLTWLILTDNQVEALPETFGADVPRLRKLALASNRLTRLPESFGALHELELVRLSNNQLAEFPWQLRELPKLTWVALGGNPYGHGHRDLSKARATLAELRLEFDEFHLDQELGSGASGIVYRASSRTQPGREYAAKMFKPVSSDGNPEDELLVSAIAATRDCPEGLIPFHGWFERPNLGLVMDFLEGADPLGMPPSLESITRDVYASDLRLSPKELQQILATMARVQEHLASQKVVHGDFYAHNILITGDRKPWLGDWGASFLYTEDEAFLEKVEVRAFGCLMEELIARTEGALSSELTALSAACLDPVLERRPPFQRVIHVLEGDANAGESDRA